MGIFTDLSRLGYLDKYKEEKCMTNLRRQRMSCSASGLSIVGLLWLMVDTNSAQQHDVADAGKVLYRQYFAICHGLDGKGKGDMAPLPKSNPPI